MMIIQSNFNSTRTAWILTALLLLTIITQIFLIGYHDTFLMELYSIEEELAEDFVAIDSFATDTINAAYEYNNNNIDEENSVRNNIQQRHNNVIHQEIITNISLIGVGSIIFGMILTMTSIMLFSLVNVVRERR